MVSKAELLSRIMGLEMGAIRLDSYLTRLEGKLENWKLATSDALDSRAARDTRQDSDMAALLRYLGLKKDGDTFRECEGCSHEPLGKLQELADEIDLSKLEVRLHEAREHDTVDDCEGRGCSCDCGDSESDIQD